MNVCLASVFLVLFFGFFFFCSYILSCTGLFVSVLSYCYFFRCLFSNEREKKTVDLGGWGGSEWGWRRGNHNQNVLHEKLFSIKGEIFKLCVKI